MSTEVTLTQLATDIAQLRQQIETINQRLDMIYGAVTRLAESKYPGGHRQNGQSPAAGNLAREQPTSSPSSSTSAPLSARMMMEPGSMLDSLRQYALDLGLEIPTETVEDPGSEAYKVDHLKSNLPEAEGPVEDPDEERRR